MSIQFRLIPATITKLLSVFLLVSASLTSFAQTSGNVHGRVTGENNEGMRDVTVMVKGTSRGTTTNANGEYSLNAGPQDSLVFSYVGFIEQHVAVSDRNQVNVVLSNSATGLNEVIVTALGIRKSIKSLTYSVDNIKGDELSKAKETNVINSLQGKVAGVTITRNATGPGSDSKVLIRGNRSITNSNEPLYVIDGVP